MMRELDLRYHAKALCDTAEMTEKDWLMLREHGPYWKDPEHPEYIPYTIGGSAIASVLNISPWLTSRGLWRKKKGIKDKIADTSGVVSKSTGHIWEPYVAQMVNYMPGHEDDLVLEDTAFYQHPLFPFMVANIDRRVIHKGEECILEIKTTNWMNTDIIAGWRKGIIPLYYEYQVRWYMSVLNIDKAFIICAWGFLPQDMVILEIKRNHEVEKMLIRKGEAFIQSLLDNKEPDFSEADPELAAEELRRMMGASARADLKEFPEENFEDFLFIKELLLKKKEDDKELDMMINIVSLDILERIGEHEGAVCKKGEEEIILSYKSSKRTTIDSEKVKKLHPAVYDACKKESISRSLKLKKEKKKKKE